MKKLLALICIISYVYAVQLPAQAKKRINDDELFLLAETGSPEQLKEAVAKGADFNVKRYGYSAELAGINTDDWLFIMEKLLYLEQLITITILKA